MIHKILWLRQKKHSPGCAFPPQAARRRHNPSKYNTKTTYHVWNDDFWQRCCVMTRGQKGSGAYVGGKIGSVSQPGHWRSISLFTPRDAQSDSRIFFNYLSPLQKRDSFSYDKGLLCLNVFTHSPLAGGEAGRCRWPYSLQGEDYFSWPCVLLFLLSLYLSGPALVRPVCALCGTVCLSVC